MHRPEGVRRKEGTARPRPRSRGVWEVGWLVLVAMFVVIAFSGYAQAETYQFLLKWGSSGAGTGEFSQPFGVAVDSSGNVYVADHLNHCIQKFDSSGGGRQENA